MSFERNRYGFEGEISFECDECGTEMHTETANFSDALAFIKRNGWKTFKDSSGWNHVCISCAMDEKA